MFPPNEIHFYLANFHPKSQIYKICLSYMCWKSYHYGWQEGRRIWLPPSRTAVLARLMRKCPRRKIFVSNQNCSYRSSCPSPPCSELAAHNRYLKSFQFFFDFIFKNVESQLLCFNDSLEYIIKGVPQKSLLI